MIRITYLSLSTSVPVPFGQQINQCLKNSDFPDFSNFSRNSIKLNFNTLNRKYQDS